MDNLIGRKFGKNNKRERIWTCKCDCGNISFVTTNHLTSGHTKSCGCYNRELIGNLNKKIGMTKTKIYYVYRNMLNRCYYEKAEEYKNYGGRGIIVCEEWKNSFENFYEWVKISNYQEGLTIDRIDVNGNYEPSNCRWATPMQQSNNKRNTRRIMINGEIDTISNHARKYNISYWNLLHYSKGGKNCMYPELDIRRV